MFKELKPTTDTEWLDIRRTVITATEVSILLGLNKWTSVSQLIENKKQVTPFENAYTIVGQWLEPVVVQAVNRALKKEFKLFENGSRSFFVDKELKLGATPDAGDSDTLLECKTTKPTNSLLWAEWPPAYYLCQLYVQLIATGREVGYLGVLSTDMSQTSQELQLDLNIHELKRSKELDDLIFEEVARFWKSIKINKLYRVNRKEAGKVELMFRVNTRKII